MYLFMTYIKLSIKNMSCVGLKGIHGVVYMRGFREP